MRCAYPSVCSSLFSKHAAISGCSGATGLQHRYSGHFAFRGAATSRQRRYLYFPSYRVPVKTSTRISTRHVLPDFPTHKTIAGSCFLDFAPLIEVTRICVHPYMYIISVASGFQPFSFLWTSSSSRATNPSRFRYTGRSLPTIRIANKYQDA